MRANAIFSLLKTVGARQDLWARTSMLNEKTAAQR